MEAPVEWRPGHECTALDGDTLHVWLVDLERVDDALAAHLHPDEHERASRFSLELQRRRWVRARGVLRALLGCYVERDPDSLRFGKHDQGKPFLLSPRTDQRPESVRFNVSHSGSLALIAVSSRIELGVDVEASARPFDAVALATRLFGEQEGNRLEALSTSLARSEFLRAWVAHEATIKCLGTGLGAPPQLGAATWVCELDLGGAAAAAVAAVRQPTQVHRWLWSAATQV